MARLPDYLEPQNVWNYFEIISQIPRGSGNEKEISNYLVNFAHEHNLEVIQDEALNVIIKKKGSPGYENAPVVILQGHMDMVCEKNKDTVHDFLKDPLDLQVEGDYIYARGTSLGADNGIAVAYGLALLTADDIAHPPLEVVFTTNEETGMDGAANLDTSNLKGKILINLDSEEEGTFLSSCAGGAKAHLNLKAQWIKEEKQGLVYSIQIRKLKGGHSGQEIDKERANANKLMGRILFALSEEINFDLISINGGAKDNAIPREADAVIQIELADKDTLIKKVEEWNDILKNEFKKSDPELEVRMELIREENSEYLSEDTKKKIISILMLMPNGVQTMSMDIKGLVESSTNLGIVITDKDEIRFISALRSSVASRKNDIINKMKALSRAVGASFYIKGDYPAWQYVEDSKIRSLFVKKYEKLYGKKAKITAIHAGLECGFFAEKIKGVDIISLGPDMEDIHTPNEKLSISSSQNTWKLLLSVLEEIK
ncbi:MAG: aminoacyl-histidine dipeptidase [Epulopiscium sp.]|mgnify:FL=1|nr:aminoacyl-histidine dipeptidase [Candidatus Epulonipiscium sp.]